jgi:hypothetical protein
MKDSEHRIGGGLINELGDEVPQGDAVASKLDLICHVHLEQGDGLPVWAAQWCRSGSVALTSSQAAMMACGVWRSCSVPLGRMSSRIAR